MEQLVRVKETHGDGTATVLVIRESACSGDCHKCSGCGAAKEAILLTVENPVGLYSLALSRNCTWEHLRRDQEFSDMEH